MLNTLRNVLFSLFIMAPVSAVQADEYQDTINIFKNAGESSSFFDKSYGYAVFPTIGKAGFIVGGAYGEGHVYQQGSYVGNTTMTQASLGFQLGGQAYSQIIFFQDKRAFEEFTGGNFEFGADANVVAITAGASAQATTTGSSAGASGGKNNANTTASGYYKGMAIFTVAKGGLMFQAAVAGQKFSYKPN
jgi:lipid-binding SYLF domain-containing protein